MKTYSKKSYKSLRTIVSTIYDQLANKIIVKINDQYVLYDKYIIKRNVDNIVVCRQRDDKIITFGVMKNAIIWIILDYNYKFIESDRIKVLDSLLVDISIDKQIHLKLKNCKNISQHIIYINKLQEDNIKHKRIMAEIDKYYKMANMCHTKEIKNESS